MIIIYLILTVCLLIASIYDATTKRIPNWISLIIIVSGLSWNYFSAEGLGLRDSGLGLVAGLLLMLPGHVFGSMGAGDVKLMAAIGSVAGFDRVLDIVLYGYLLMLVMAVLFVTVKGDLIKLLLRYKMLLFGLFSGILAYQKPDSSEAAGQRMPLAPAITLSTFYVLYPEICNLRFMVNICHF
ncbi:MAG: A24 family peptidase [Methylococcales bacterium]|nr:A24 family peptidase [Methylococcales bacterium]